MKSAKELKKFKSKMSSKKNMTPSERLAKELLEKDNRNYKQQMILGFYILDFVFPEKMLVVEIDGEYHDTDYARWYDKKRDQFIRRCNFEIVRLKNQEAHRIVEVISEYPNLVNWEKKFRHSLSRANMYKGKIMKEKNTSNKKLL